MEAKLLEIAWHEKSPIWSVDISADNRIVTAGGDKVARVWRLNPSTSPPPSSAARSPTVDWLCDLRAHLTTVNIARFSLSGFNIATGADQGEIVVWRYAPDQAAGATCFEGADAENNLLPRERWSHDVTLRGHVQDVLDLAWAADGHTLVSASVDNSIMVWDIRNPSQAPFTIRSHSNYVQGVAIDPVGKIIASLGNDRALRVFSKAGSTPWAPVAVATAITSEGKLFVDDSKFKTFFRRLAWSPDGSVLACPSGLQFPGGKKAFAVHLFARNHWSVPAAQCGGLLKPACVVRFNPILFAMRNPPTNTLVQTRVPEKSEQPTERDTQQDGQDSPRPGSSGPFKGFTYRMVFAVACADCILFYDTESFTRPFAKVDGLHCAEHTDISWSKDGRNLIVSSVDGYASVISFPGDELGEKLPEDQVPRWLREFCLQREFRSPSKGIPVTTKIKRVVPKAVGGPVSNCPAKPDQAAYPKPNPSSQVAKPAELLKQGPLTGAKVPGAVNAVKAVQQSQPQSESALPPCQSKGTNRGGGVPCQYREGSDSHEDPSVQKRRRIEPQVVVD